MILRLTLLFARLRSLRSKPSYTLVLTEVGDELPLHGGDMLDGDMLDIVSNENGTFCLGANRLIYGDFDFYPIAYSTDEAQLLVIKFDLNTAIMCGDKKFDARTPAHKRTLDELRRLESTEGAPA